MAGGLYETNFEMIKKLYNKTQNMDSERNDKLMNDAIYNYLACSAANFQQQDFLSHIMSEASVLDYKIDL